MKIKLTVEGDAYVAITEKQYNSMQEALYIATRIVRYASLKARASKEHSLVRNDDLAELGTAVCKYGWTDREIKEQGEREAEQAERDAELEAELEAATRE